MVYLFMQEHQQHVYNTIHTGHTGNTQYFAPIHIYIEHIQICVVYVAIHAGHTQGVLHECPYSYIQDTQDVLCPYIHAQIEGLVMCKT